MSRILIVEDAPAYGEPLAVALEHHGYQTQFVPDGIAALEALKTSTPDLILLDIAMPRMDGLKLLRTLRQSEAWAAIPVVLLTAVVKREYIVEAGKLGVHDYLLKSQFSLAELLARIDKSLSGRAETAAAAPTEPTKDDGADSRAEPNARATSSAKAAPTPAPTGDGPATAEKPTPTRLELPTDMAGPEALKTLKPLLTRSEMIDRLDHCGEIKALSPTIAQLLKMTNSPNCSIDGVVRTIKQDHGLALKILKVANSTVYTRGEPVESVQKAVMRIGLTQIRQTLLNIGVIEQFSGDCLDGRLDSLQFWEHSIACGLIAAELARLTGGGDAEADACFTMGLIHDVGKLVYADMLGEMYDTVVDVSNRLELPMEMVESRLLLLNHADGMDRILHAWRFPKQLINPIVFHHLSMGNIRHMARNSVSEVATVALADRLAHALLLGHGGNTTLYPTHEFCQALNLADRDVARIVDEIPDQAVDLRITMLSRQNQPASVDHLTATRQKLEMPVAPLFVADQPGLDGYGVLADRLRSPDAPETPNIALVHIAHARQREALTRQLYAAEQEAGVGKLPTIILAPKPELTLRADVMEARPSRTLTTPVPLPAMVRAINALLTAEPAAASAA